MPNWCENSGYVRLPANASAEAQEAFKKLAEGNTKEWFSNVLPCPPEMRLGIDNAMGDSEYMSLKWLRANSKFQGDFGKFSKGRMQPTPEYVAYLKETFGATEWYHWNLANYGTKWDVKADLSVIENEIMFTFDSAWCPPVEFFNYLAQTFGLEYECRYVEHGMGFCGVASYVGGEFLADEGEYNSSDYFEDEEEDEENNESES